MNELINLQKGHQRARLLVFMVVIGCLIIAFASLILSYVYANDFSKRVYIINKGVALEALSANVRDNRLAEAKFHVTRLHELFFTLAPDARSIEANYQKATFLADESIKFLFDRLKEDQFYQKLIQSNTTQRLEIQSVEIDMKTYPYKATAIFKLYQERASNRTSRWVATESYLYDVNRSEVNPNGFLVRKFRIVKRSESKNEVKDEITETMD